MCLAHDQGSHLPGHLIPFSINGDEETKWTSSKPECKPILQYPGDVTDNVNK